CFSLSGNVSASEAKIMLRILLRRRSRRRLSGVPRVYARRVPTRRSLWCRSPSASSVEPESPSWTRIEPYTSNSRSLHHDMVEVQAIHFDKNGGFPRLRLIRMAAALTRSTARGSEVGSPKYQLGHFRLQASYVSFVLPGFVRHIRS